MCSSTIIPDPRAVRLVNPALQPQNRKPIVSIGTMAVPFATRKTFLDLPPELRRAIYECSLDDMLRMEGKLTVWSGGRRSVVFDWRKWRNGARDQGTGTGTGLRTLWTCKQIRTEVGGLGDLWSWNGC